MPRNTKKTVNSKKVSKKFVKKTVKLEKPKRTPKVYAYARVSSNKQADPDHATQVFQINKYLEDNEYGRVNKVIQDIGSARNPENLPNLIALLNIVRSGDRIWVHRYDRFSRNVAFATTWFNKLAKKNVKVYSIMECYDYTTSQGKSMINNIFNNAEFESNQRSIIVKQTFDAIKAAGGIIGQAPFGTQLMNPKKRSREEVVESRKNGTYKLPDRRIESNIDEQRILEILRGLRYGTKSLNQINTLLEKVAECKQFNPIEIVDNKTEKLLAKTEPNALSYQNLADLMNEYEVPYRSETKWSSVIIRRLLNNPLTQPDIDTELILETEAINMLDEPEVNEPSSALLPRERPHLQRAVNIYVPYPTKKFGR